MLNVWVSAYLGVHSDLAVVRNVCIQCYTHIRVKVLIETLKHIIALGTQQLRINHEGMEMPRKYILWNCSISTRIKNSCIICTCINLARHYSVVNDFTWLNLIDEVIVQFLIIVIVSEVIEDMSTANAYISINQIISQLVRASWLFQRDIFLIDPDLLGRWLLKGFVFQDVSWLAV